MRFGSREICDVTFKTTRANQKVGDVTYANKYQPVFVIDTATASTLSQATSVVYAQGGKGYNRLISWEGEKTMTFTVTDALLSPKSLAVLTNAGEVEEGKEHFHVTLDLVADATGAVTVDLKTLEAELGIEVKAPATGINICADVPVFANILDDFGAIEAPISDAGTIDFGSGNTAASANYLKKVTSTAPAKISFGSEAENKTLKVDFYVIVEDSITSIRIKPESFGGNFYIEADTLYRNQAGEDMAAALTFPQVKVQSAFELAMSPTGDPSTFDFTMDAMPGYTMFDKTHKTCVDIQIIGGASKENEKAHTKVKADKDHSSLT